MSVASIDIEWPEEGYFNNSKEEDEQLLLLACNKVDRVLDIIRVMYCRMDNPLMNPGLPGLTPSGYSAVAIVRPDDSKRYRIIGTRLYGLTLVNGLGLELDNYEIDSIFKNSSLLDIALNCSNKYVPLLCKSILKRLSEAMYIPLIDSKFTYLMTTLEIIASPKYINFKKVKSKITPLIANNKQSYHQLSEELRVLSEEIRTEIVHNGKSLVEIQKDNYKKILLNLQSIIVKCAIAMSQSGCESIENIAEYREKRKKELGI